jgi:hypothetical protein
VLRQTFRDWCRSINSFSNLKDERVVATIKLESPRVFFTIAEYPNFSDLLNRLWEHEVLHRSITLLLSALAVASDKVEAIIIIVLNYSKPKVTSISIHKLISYCLVWKLNFFILVVR